MHDTVGDFSLIFSTFGQSQANCFPFVFLLYAK